MVKLRGIAWDHPRGYDPLIAASKEYKKLMSDVDIEWDVRSLKDFGDMPIEILMEKYDLLTIDHPYMGQADKNQLLVALEDYVSGDVLKTLEQESVGPSFKSYFYNEHIYALPIDAAALVAAYRKDLVDKLGLKLPKTHQELDSFYLKLPSEFSVAWALCPTDFWCTFLTLCAQIGGRTFIDKNQVNKKLGSKVLDTIKFQLEYLHPESMNWNPIQILDRMGDGDSIIYSPYLFGYTNYSRKGYKQKIVHFTNSPVGINSISTILGGVGLAVSSKCKNSSVAAKFVEFVASDKIQTGIFTRFEGQPGNIKAWKNKDNNILCNNFFFDTMETMENAYVRPQHPGWNQFQEQGADLLHNGVLKNVDSDKVMDELNQLYKTIDCDD